MGFRIHLYGFWRYSNETWGNRCFSSSNFLTNIYLDLRDHNETLKSLKVSLKSSGHVSVSSPIGTRCVPASVCALQLAESADGTRRCTNRWGTRGTDRGRLCFRKLTAAQRLGSVDVCCHCQVATRIYGFAKTLRFPVSFLFSDKRVPTVKAWKTIHILVRLKIKVQVVLSYVIINQEWIIGLEAIS